MTTHRVPVPAVHPTRITMRFLIIVTLLAALGLASAAIAADADKSASAGGATKVYTNADLRKYATESDDRSVVTNRNLKEPLPTQSAPIVDSPGDWEFVLRMLDREREDAARSRELAYAAAQAATGEPEPAPTYYYPYPYFFGFNNDNPHRRHHSRVPTNTFRPLDERGIRTPRQLWQEGHRNAQTLSSGIAPSDTRRSGNLGTVPSRH